MTVAARFFVSSIRRPEPESSQGTAISLGAVCRGAANSEWSSATPVGSISMTVRNESAIAQFEQGEEYEVTFRKVEKPVEGDGHSVQAFKASYATTWSCGVCGFYADGQQYGVDVDDPATLDWSKHDEHFKGKSYLPHLDLGSGVPYSYEQGRRSN